MTLLPLPSPENVLGAGRAFVGWTAEVVDVAGRLPARVDDLLDEVTRLVGVLGGVVERAETLLDRAEAAVDGIDTVLVEARTVAAGAAGVVESAASASDGATRVVDQADGISTRADRLLEAYRPTLEAGAPLARRFVEEFSQEELDATIKLVDQVPVFTEHMVSDIMPILETLDRVGPDISELLDVTKELRQAIDGIPGLGFLKKRGAEKNGE